MGITDLAILGLMATILVFSIIELGLSAYAVSVTDGTYYGYRRHTPGEYAFLLFNSLWTLLVVGALAVLDFLSGRKGGISRPYPWLGWATLGLTFITWVFWLAGFSALAAFFGGNPQGTAGALLAFAVMLWYAEAPFHRKTTSLTSAQASVHGTTHTQRPDGLYRPPQRPPRLPTVVQS